MSEQSNQHLINEFCHIYRLRIDLTDKKNSLRYKYNYLLDVKRAIQVRKNLKSSEFFKVIKHMGPDAQARAIDNYKFNNPVPKKYKDTSLCEIRMLILEAQRNVLNAKMEIMEHTKKYQDRLAELSDKLKMAPRYVHGAVRCIVDNNKYLHSNYIEPIKKEQIILNSDQHQLSLAMDKILEGK